MEDVIKVEEIQLKIQPHASNQPELSKREAEFKKYLQVEEGFFSLKARIPLYIKGKWKKLHIGQIFSNQEITLQRNVQIDQVVL